MHHTSLQKDEKWTLLEVPPFRIQAKDFMTPVFSMSRNKFNIHMVSIPGLDDVLIPDLKEIFLLIEQPFPRKWRYKISQHQPCAGLTKRDIICGIRAAYEHGYRHDVCKHSQFLSSTDEEIIPLSSISVTGVYTSNNEPLIRLNVSGVPLASDPTLPF